MSSPWILVVDAGDYDRTALHDSVRTAAEPLGTVHTEVRGGRLVLVVPSEGAHPVAVAIRFPAILAHQVAAARDPVRLVIDYGATPDLALRIAGALHGPAVDPPLTFALTEEARRALGQGEDPVPLRGFRKVTIDDAGDELDAWIRTPDHPTTAAPSDPGDGGRWFGDTYGDRMPGEHRIGPPPGPDFPTGR